MRFVSKEEFAGACAKREQTNDTILAVCCTLYIVLYCETVYNENLIVLINIQICICMYVKGIFCSTKCVPSSDNHV